MNYIDIHTHKNLKSDHIQIRVKDFTKGETLSSKFDAIGIHPWSLPISNLDGVLADFEKYIALHTPWLLGEMGIDRAIDSNVNEQKELFKHQIKLATKYKINALVIHSVKAYSDVLELLIHSNYKGRLLLHDFNSNIATADQFNRHFETYFSFGHKLFKPQTNAAKSFLEIAREQILLETDDSPDLLISEVYNQAAELLKIDLKTLSEQMQKNFSQFSNALFTDRDN